MNISEYRGVMVFAEQRRGEIQKVAFELLGAGRVIADNLQEPLLAVLAGANLSEQQAHSLIAHGADRVILIDDPRLAIYMTEPYTKVLSAVIETEKPGIAFFGATTIGRDLAPRVSARVKTGLTADCTSLQIDDASRNLLMTRPAFGGNIMATIICPEHRPQMATVRPGVMRRLEADASRSGEIIRVDSRLTDDDINVEIIEEVIQKAEKKNIEDAAILIAGGRGLGNPENFKSLEALAEALNGQVAASRAVVDAGWVAQDKQVGQTGKTVRPDLYLACGISGMIQHVAGMEESGFIVAVNKNKSAPIFEYADIGIVTDVNRLIPALQEELNQARAQQ